MADLNGAGSTTLGGLTAHASGHIEWWKAHLSDTPVDWYVSEFTALDLGVLAETWDGSAVNVEVQVGTDPTWAAAPFWTQTLTNVAGDNVTESRVQVSNLVDSTRYFWRARSVKQVGSTTYTGNWTPNKSFMVSIDSSDAIMYIYENVGVASSFASSDEVYIYENVGVMKTPSARATQYQYENIGVNLDRTVGTGFAYAYEGDVSQNTPTPHVWWLNPGSGRPGDGVRIVGLGFGDLQSTFAGVVEVNYGGSRGWEQVQVISWQTYPADPPAYTAERVMDEVSMTIDPQHTIIEITVPDDAIPPGYPVRVRTDGA